MASSTKKTPSNLLTFQAGGELPRPFVYVTYKGGTHYADVQSRYQKTATRFLVEI